MKPLEYFWEKFASDVPYDDDAIRCEWQERAATEVMGELRPGLLDTIVPIHALVTDAQGED